MQAEAERTSFNILELHCFPKGCCIDAESQPYLATVHIPKLEAAGMKVAEWTLGALNLEEPHLSMVKSIVCKGCRHTECIHNAKHPTPFSALMEGRYPERMHKGDDLVRDILPMTKKAEIEALGIKIEGWHQPSRQNPRLLFSFCHKEKRVFIVCEIGKRLLKLNGTSEESLTSVDQVRRKIDEVTQSLR